MTVPDPSDHAAGFTVCVPFGSPVSFIFTGGVCFAPWLLKKIKLAYHWCVVYVFTCMRTCV